MASVSGVSARRAWAISISMRSMRLRRLARPVRGSVRLSVCRPFTKLARLVTRRNAAASSPAASAVCASVPAAGSERSMIITSSPLAA